MHAVDRRGRRATPRKRAGRHGPRGRLRTGRPPTRRRSGPARRHGRRPPTPRRTRRCAAGGLQPRLAALVQDPFLVPDVADLLHAPAVVHVQAGVAAAARRAGRRERRRPRAGRGDEFAVAQQEADLRQLRRRRPVLLEEHPPAQRRQRVVVQRVGVEAVEVDEGDVVEPQNQPAVAPGVAPRTGRLIDPAVQDAPVGEALAGGDRRQADVVLRRRRRRRRRGVRRSPSRSAAATPGRSGRGGGRGRWRSRCGPAGFLPARPLEFEPGRDREFRS